MKKLILKFSLWLYYKLPKRKRKTVWGFMNIPENERTFNDIYDEIVNDLKGNLTSDEYKELITLEYVLTWGYNEPSDSKRYDELRNKKYELIR